MYLSSILKCSISQSIDNNVMLIVIEFFLTDLSFARYTYLKEVISSELILFPNFMHVRVGFCKAVFTRARPENGRLHHGHT